MWTKYIKSKVFTSIKTDCEKKLKSKFPDIYFTTSARVNKTPKFPTVYIKELPSAEMSRDTEGRNVNGILKGFQIDVIDNKSENNASTVADVVYDIMKSMRFDAIGEPYPDENGDEYRIVSRFRRAIADNDNF